MDAMPNVLLIVLDSVRAKNTSLYDHSLETTPCLERIAEHATTYEQARTAGVGSLQSHASMFTGLAVDEHRLTNEEHKLRSGVTIFDDLAADGYETGVFSMNTFLTQLSVGLKDAFQRVESGIDARLPFSDGLDPRTVDTQSSFRHFQYILSALCHNRPIKSLWNGLVETLPSTVVEQLPDRYRKQELTADVYADAFLEWQAERDQPWAACVNFMDAHMPVLPMEEHNLWADEATNHELRNVDGAVWPYLSGDQPLEQLRRFERLYDGAIHQADAAVGHLVRTLAERDELANTMVVITGDHGEGYGEPDSIRGMHSIGHGVAGGLVEEVLHVPLVVKFPGQTDSKIISAPATTARFPVATDAVRDGEWSHDLFVPDDAVVSSMEGINPALVRRASQYLDDLEPFRTAGQAVFVPDGDTVRKYVRWGETRHAFVCPDAQTTTELNIDPSTYEHHFVERRQADVLSDEDVKIPPGVRRQLEDLGYA